MQAPPVQDEERPATSSKTAKEGPAPVRQAPPVQLKARSAISLKEALKEARSWTWKTMPADPPFWLEALPVFLEVYAGKAVLTRAFRKAGWVTLPPIEKEISAEVPTGVDITDKDMLQRSSGG